jgi:hypothetical protein
VLVVVAMASAHARCLTRRVGHLRVLRQLERDHAVAGRLWHGDEPGVSVLVVVIVIVVVVVVVVVAARQGGARRCAP